MDEKPAPLDAADVEALVGNAHGDLDAVRKLLDAQPALVNSAWDWGGGDWETALGAAAHMDRRDIAEFLLESGARLDVFAAAMLGKEAVVRALVEDDPRVARSLGPHGLPLLAHAKAGGEAAAGVVAYLESLASEARS